MECIREHSRLSAVNRQFHLTLFGLGGEGGDARADFNFPELP